MRVRQPDFDFSEVDPVWGDDVKAVHKTNAGGLIPAYVEPYLIKVMRQARRHLNPAQYPDLIDEVDIFIKQEAQHFKVHRAFNARIRENGYPGIADIERDYAADYERFLSEKSLRWNVAYCEGFEAFAAADAKRWVDGTQAALFGSADPAPVEMWRWHLAEEYEHRTVVFRVFNALYGHQPIRAYGTRVRGFFAAGKHIQSYVGRMYEYLMREYYEQTGSEELPDPANIRDMKAILKCLSPFYDPAHVPPPTQVDDVLSSY